MPLRARISGIGTCVPEKVLTNADLEKMVDTSDEWIRTRTGICERRIVDPEQNINASDLGTTAAKIALDNAGVSASEIDCIICATGTPDYAFPSTACVIQEKIGAKNATAYDVIAACTGFVYGLDIANAYIRSEKCRKVLIVSCEVLSKIVDWKDRNTCVLFGDAAGAAVVSAEESDSGILSTYTRTDGTLGNILHCSAWGDPRYLSMNGSEVFKNAVRMMGEAAVKCIERAGLTINDVDLLVPHQANIRIINATAKHVNLPMEKVVVNVDKYGNTSSATIPLALNDAMARNQLKEGNVIVMVAFGSGLSWGSVLAKW